MTQSGNRLLTLRFFDLGHFLKSKPGILIWTSVQWLGDFYVSRILQP